jgi:hypothetical protein
LDISVWSTLLKLVKCIFAILVLSPFEGTCCLSNKLKRLYFRTEIGPVVLERSKMRKADNCEKIDPSSGEQKITMMLYLFSIGGHQESIGATRMIEVVHGCCRVQSHQLQCREVPSHDAIVLGDKTVGSVGQTPLSIVYICGQTSKSYVIYAASSKYYNCLIKLKRESHNKCRN